MRASGNGRPDVCAANLLRISRGEIPFDRVRGLSADLIDSPIGRYGDAAADAEWVLRTYEPRVDVEDALTAVSISDVAIAARINLRQEDETDE